MKFNLPSSPIRNLSGMVGLFTLALSCTTQTAKNTETEQAVTQEVETPTTPTDDQDKTILFFGNSLTAGMGLSTEEAFPALIQEVIDSLELDYTVVNAGLSGETTASGKSRLNWVLNQKVDVFVLELGANDGLRGIPLDETRTNLQAIIDMVWVKNPDTKIVIAGMQIPPNMGQDYTSEFRTIFPNLAEKNNIVLIPFLLDNVAGLPNLNQPDGIHPTVEGHKIVASNVWDVLEGVL
jgi:acyl-CoA thioesterase I